MRKDILRKRILEGQFRKGIAEGHFRKGIAEGHFRKGMKGTVHKLEFIPFHHTHFHPQPSISNQQNQTNIVLKPQATFDCPFGYQLKGDASIW